METLARDLSALTGWTSDDSFFGPAYFDIDETRDAPAPHRYIHGGFQDTDTRFSLCIPESGYSDRLVMFLQGGMGGNENQGMLLNGVAVAFENGAMFAESNQGHIGNDMSGLRGDMTVLTFRASRQTALLAKAVADHVFGRPVHHSYIYGGSGGGLRSIECLERCPDVWDGAVPFIINRNGLLTYNWSLLCWATLTLGESVRAVIDATDAGGSGDPFASLSPEQRNALSLLYKGGYCRGAEAQIEPSPLWVMGIQLVERADPGFFTDFWNQPGYAGADGDPSVDAMRVEGSARVELVRTARDLAGTNPETDDINAAILGRAPGGMSYGLVLDGVAAPDRLLGATLRFTSGAAEGRVVRCTGVVGDAVTAVLDPVGFRDVMPGDTLEFDNRDLVAFAFHHRHMVADTYPEMAAFVVDGRAVYPQRPLKIGHLPVPSGDFQGRMIVLQHGADKECWPSCARAYEQSVRRHRGEGVDEVFRLWWLEKAAHVQPTTADGRARVITYGGEVAQAVRDLIAWVEDGTEPPPSTAASFGPDNDLRLPGAAADRLGIQPVVTLESSTLAKAPGAQVDFFLTAEVPPGAGEVVEVAFDLDGSGLFRDVVQVTPARRVELTHRVVAPGATGTWFVAARVASHREADPSARRRRVHNIARARVVISDEPVG